MGYRIDANTIKANLFIPASDFNKAFELAKKHSLSQESFCRVERCDIINATNLKEYIGAMRWSMKLDKNGNFVSIYNYGLNVADEELLFESIAYFMKDGSYVEFEREGHSGQEKEHYDFHNGSAKKTKFVKEYDMEDKEFWQEI